MSTETLSAPASGSETEQPHFVHGVMDRQSQAVESDDGNLNERSTEGTVDAADPEKVHLFGDVVLAEVIEERDFLYSEAFANLPENSKKRIIDTLVNLFLASDASEGVTYFENRDKLRNLLTASDEEFDELVQQYAVNDTEDETTSFKERFKHLFRSQADTREGEKGEELPPSTKLLRKELKKSDREFDGLVGDIAKTGTKPQYLANTYERYLETMDAKGHEINDRNRSSAERETIREMLSPFVEAQKLDGDDKKAYEDHLVAAFHTYTNLTDAEREHFHATLEARYETARTLGELEKSDAPESKTSQLRSRTQRAIGAVAASVVTQSKTRWDARKSRTADTSTAQDKHTPKHRKKSTDRLRSAITASKDFSPSDTLARYRTKQQMRRFDREHMSSEERQKRRKNKALTVIGAVGIAAAGVYLYKYGFDNPFNDANGMNRSGSAGEIPENPPLFDSVDNLVDDSIEKIYDAASETDRKDSPALFERLDSLIDDTGDKLREAYEAVETDGNDGGDDGGSGGSNEGGTNGDAKTGESVSTRDRMFDGRFGSRHMTPEAHSHLVEHINGYTVKPGDSVWKLSQQYLQSQGISNPTLFEIDATKDIFLKNLRQSGHVDSHGWLTVGDKLSVR